ncbi:hypothetical protein ACRN9Z_15130 [Shewanella frigidimarina]|uniref:ORC-CDC6 family AAA ATPase n=1 Tax=Shewanella frigidimarina TaxID=56812 RepID=UPI003D7B42A5
MENLVEQSKKLTSILATNRTENIGMDVWDEFVVPRYFDKYDFFSTMPCKIEGGRGCGKTMLLRYLSYQSQFSKKRKIVKDDDLKNIGLYWRADTQFLRQLDKRGISEDFWAKTFIHYFSLKVTIEIFKAIDFIARTSKQFEHFSKILITELCIYDESLDGELSTVKDNLERLRKKFELAISNPLLLEKVIFFPFDFVKSVNEEIQDKIPELKDTNFHVFIDEYENLLKYQQIIVNTSVKHSEPPVIFKIACKKNGMPFIETTGDEAIVLKHDFVAHDLDDYISKEYNVFASEVLFSRLAKAGGENNSICLSNIDSLHERRKDEYTRAILNKVRKMLPGKKQNDLASDIFIKPVLRTKLENMLTQALDKKREKQLIFSDFIRDDAKEASIVCVALLNRKSTDPTELLHLLDLHIAGAKTPFNEWISTNFIGCYLNIIKRKRDENRLYCGFDTFISLSQGNLRHFLELCRTAFSVGFHYDNSEFVISEEFQSFSASQTSAILFDEIKSFKPYGAALHIFANRLGELFTLHQSRESQSEPEKNHFSITGGSTSLTSKEKLLLNECEKWGVLSKVIATKTKTRQVINDYDWVLNPIYAPRFGISYRKKRKITFSNLDIQSLFSDDISDYEELYESHKILGSGTNNLVKDKNNPIKETPFNSGDIQKDLFDV